MHPLARFVTGRWTSIAILVAAFAIAGVALGAIGQAERDTLPTDSLPRGSQSAMAAELADRLPTADTSTAVILFSSDERLSKADLAFATERLRSLDGALPAPPTVSEDRTAAIGIVQIDSIDVVVVQEKVDAMRAELRDGLPAGLNAQVTGPAGVQADLAAVFAGADLRLLFVTATVVAVLLVLTYRSPVLWIVPLAVVGIADQVAAVAATRTLAFAGVPWDESTVGILSVLVFGAGTDYALLLISRYRDELRRHDDRREAMAVALTRTTEAVISSAVTVFVGLLTLLLSLIPATQGLGLGCAVGVLIAAAAALVVLPAALVQFGRWVFWPRIPRVGEPVIADGRSLWRAVGHAVAARPAVFTVVTLVLLGIAGAGTTRIQTGLSDADQFLRTPEAIVAAERLAESFPAGQSDPTRIVAATEEPEKIADIVADVPGVTSARVSADGDAVSEIQAVLDADPDTPEARQTVEDIRAALSDRVAYVGGGEAEALDLAEATARDRSVILPTILALVFVALIFLIRSLVAPVVLVATVVLTYLSSLGLSWVLFTRVFGFERLDDGAPLLAFVFLVALGVDYNIFLITRAREEGRVHGSRDGMLRGLAATGGVITSAGILLAAVFAVLGVLPLVVLAQIGVIICVGVLLDTLVVRTVLVPAIALLLGERFWWPGSVRDVDRERARHCPVIAVTGATGRLGGRVARLLADQNVPQRLLARTPERAPRLPGAEIVQASYERAAAEALEGVDTLLMVSASESPDRLQQHRDFVDAAAAAGVGQLVYISFAGASPNATFTLARDHFHTEEHIKASGLRYTFLRDCLYSDFVPELADTDGVIRGPAGDGRVAFVAQDDIAESAAAVLQDPAAHAGRTYTLTGPDALTLTDAARIWSEVSGRDVSFENETVEQAYASRAHYDAEPWQLDAWVSTYTAMASGELATVTGDIEQLTGHAPRDLASVLRGRVE